MSIFKEGLNEKVIYAVALVVALGVVYIYSGQKEKAETLAEPQIVAAAASTADNSEIAALEKSTEEKIAQSLEDIQGVGKAKVLVTFNSGIKREYAIDKSITTKTSKQTDKDGGVSEVEEVTETTKLVMSGNSSPVVVSEQKPDIAGVLVIAQGGDDPKIREQVSLAVQTLLNLPAAKVTVVPMEGK